MTYLSALRPVAAKVTFTYFLSLWGLLKTHIQWQTQTFQNQRHFHGVTHLLKLSVPPHWLQREPTIWHSIFGLFLVISERFYRRTNHRRNLAPSNGRWTQFKWKKKSMDLVFLIQEEDWKIKVISEWCPLDWRSQSLISSSRPGISLPNLWTFLTFIIKTGIKPYYI